MKRVAIWLAVILVVIFVVARPAAAAGITKWLGSVIIKVGIGFGDFLTRLVS